ncbi:hypothetical protein [Zavarzinella formosa]|uniref:hypothetical protein n=1 Tax=Zavarzinella formosa TaxID=360055 RepID=UPI00030846AA|nr:hypothetical protein [Zavarzinella formosa]
MKKTLILSVLMFAGCQSPAPRCAYHAEPKPFHRERQVTTTETETLTPVDVRREPLPRVENITVRPTSEPPKAVEALTIPPANIGGR